TQYSATVVQLLLLFWWCAHHTIQCNRSAVAPTFLHTKQCNRNAVAPTFLVVYTAHNTVQCGFANQNIHHVRKATKERQMWQTTKRGQASSVSTVNSAGRGHGASSAGGRGARLSFFSAAGRVIELEHAEELVELITKLSSSSSSSVTQAQSSLPSNADAKVAYSTGSLSSPSIAPPSCTISPPNYLTTVSGTC
ncbi:hypothetical protein AB205_0046020, partial [Aquarana catesbeiana]